MQKFWHIPTYPQPRRVTATALPMWDERDRSATIAVANDTFLDALPIWAFALLMLGAFVLFVVLFGYVLT